MWNQKWNSNVVDSHVIFGDVLKMVTLSILWGDLPAGWIPSNGQHFANTHWIIATWHMVSNMEKTSQKKHPNIQNTKMRVGSIQAIFTYLYRFPLWIRTNSGVVPRPPSRLGVRNESALSHWTCLGCDWKSSDNTHARGNTPTYCAINIINWFL